MPTFLCASEKNTPKHFNRRPNDDDKYSHEDLNELSRLVDNLAQIRLRSNHHDFIQHLDFAEQMAFGSISSPNSFRHFSSYYTWIVRFVDSYKDFLNLVNENAYSNFFNHARVAKNNTKDSKKISQLDCINFRLAEYHHLRIKPLINAKRIIDQLSMFSSKPLHSGGWKRQIAFFLLCKNHPINEPKIDNLRLINTITHQWSDLWKAYKLCIENSGSGADAIVTIDLFISRVVLEFANESNFFQSFFSIVKNHWCSATSSGLLLGEINKALQFSQLANVSLIEAVTQLHKIHLNANYQLLLMQYYSHGLRPEHFYINDDANLYSAVLRNWIEADEYIISLDSLFQKLRQVPSSQWIRYMRMLIGGDLFLEFALAKNWSECLSFLKLSSNVKSRFLSLADTRGAQSIHHFASAGHLELVTLAIAQGASLITQTHYHKTPIQLAAENEHWDVVSKIVEIHAANSDDSEHYGLALALAAQAEKWDVCELLVRANASLRFALDDILHFFCKSGQLSLLQLCFHNENNRIYFRNSMSMTHKYDMPIVLAANNNHWETVLLLRGYDYDEAHSRPIYHYLLNLAVSRAEFSFIKNMLTRYPQHLLSLDLSYQLICLVVLQKYQDAIAFMIQHKERCLNSLSSHVIAAHSNFTDFFTKECDFHTIEFDLNLTSQLVAFGVPIDKFSDTSREKLLTGDDYFSLPIATFYRIVLAKIPPDILRASFPPIPMHHITADCTIKINQLNNLNFIEFTRWLCLLKDYLKKNQQIDLLRKITTMLSRSHDVLACGIDHLYLDSLYRQLSAMPSPITLFSRDSKPNLTEALKAFYPDIRNFVLMAQLLKQYKEVFFTLRLHDVRFHILLYFACFLSRAIYPRHSFLPDTSAEIGVLLSRCEDHDMDDLILVGASFQDAKIIVVSEFLQVFNESHDFTDPVTREPMDEQMVLALLQHPKIRAAVVAADEKEKTDVQTVARYRPIVIEVVNKLAELGQILYDASTDSGRQTFDENAANNAVAAFRAYSDNLPVLVVNALHAPGLSFYLDTRRGAMTNYSQLFSQMTFGGCSGQLGLTIREWVSKFRDKERIVLAGMHFTKLSRYLDLMVSVPMNPMYVNQAIIRDCKMSGKGFVKALLLEQERLVSQLRY